MKLSALVLATAAIIATASAVKELGPNQYCHHIETQATCEEYTKQCAWEGGKLHHYSKLARFHRNLMCLLVVNKICHGIGEFEDGD